MNKRRVTNVAAAVRQRPQNSARSSGRPFHEVLQYYAMERFLYRLAQSPHADRFVLKGALMFHVWRASTSRATKDIDLFGPIGVVFSSQCMAQTIEQPGRRGRPGIACRNRCGPVD